jgi:hypothetical protein
MKGGRCRTMLPLLSPSQAADLKMKSAAYYSFLFLQQGSAVTVHIELCGNRGCFRCEVKIMPRSPSAPARSTAPRAVLPCVGVNQQRCKSASSIYSC